MDLTRLFDAPESDVIPVDRPVARTAVIILSYLRLPDVARWTQLNKAHRNTLLELLINTKCTETFQDLIPRLVIPTKVPALATRPTRIQSDVKADLTHNPFNVPHFVIDEDRRLTRNLSERDFVPRRRPTYCNDPLIVPLFLRDIWVDADNLAERTNCEMIQTPGVSRTDKATEILDDVLSGMLRSPLTLHGKGIKGLRLCFLSRSPCLSRFMLQLADANVTLDRFASDQSSEITSEEFGIFAQHCLAKVAQLRIFSNLTLTSESVSSIIQRASFHLVEINLAGSTCLTDPVVELIARKANHLEVLDITRGLRLSHPSFICLCEGRFDQLWYLRSYANQHLPHEAYRSLAKILGRLEYMDLCGSLLTDAQMMASIQSERSRPLKALNLTWCKTITNTTVQLLLSSNPSIVWLSLHGLSKLDDDCFQPKDGIVAPNLAALDVRGTRMTCLHPRAQFPSCNDWALAR